MPHPPVTNLETAYTQTLPSSKALFERARNLFPDGVTHDNRRMQPFPLFVDRADGAYKWDADGRCYIDYWMGHGALLLGHNPPQIRDAITAPAMRWKSSGANGSAAWSPVPSACASRRRARKQRIWRCAWHAPIPAASG
jgi:4-aminobutyrate aminotransferase-like enzyme